MKEKFPDTIGDFLKVTLKKIMRQKKYALLPLWVLLVFLGLVILLSGHSTILPTIYMLF